MADVWKCPSCQQESKKIGTKVFGYADGRQEAACPACGNHVRYDDFASGRYDVLRAAQRGHWLAGLLTGAVLSFFAVGIVTWLIGLRGWTDPFNAIEWAIIAAGAIGMAVYAHDRPV
jgi:hypothetical protein